MEKSKVYFTNLRTTFDCNLLQKLKKLITAAGIGNIDFTNKYAAIKIHFGEPGNLAFLRPNYAKVVADTVKELGGKPFLTDCNTLYVGGRKNALDHLDAAYENGFSPFSTGCHVLIADGLKGTDETLVPIAGDYVKEAKIGTAIMDADVFISLTHFKGHEATGFGGCLKNIGMGCGSRAGKMEMHSSGKPHVAQEKCVGCGSCQKDCAHSALTLTDRKASLDHAKCVGWPVHRALSRGRGAGCQRRGQRHPQLQNCRVHLGRHQGQAQLPHQPGGGCLPLLRLPQRKRPAHCARRGHVRLL